MPAKRAAAAKNKDEFYEVGTWNGLVLRCGLPFSYAVVASSEEILKARVRSKKNRKLQWVRLYVRMHVGC